MQRFCKLPGTRHAKQKRADQFRPKCMKRTIANNEMSPGRANLVMRRGGGRGFWFVVQTASLASERRNQSLARKLRAESVFGNPYLGRTGHRPVPSGESPDGMA